MTKQEKIAKKVRNLFAIAGDKEASDAEIQNAMNHAHRLMGEYHLSEEDLGHEPQNDYEKVDESKFNRKRSFIGKKIFAWESHLSHFISKFVGIPYYLDHDFKMVRKNGFVQFDEKENPRKGKSIVFYGIDEDAAIASELYDELRLLIATMAVASWGSVYKGDGAVYSEGFVSGLLSQLRESEKLESKVESSTAMVLVHRREDLIKYKKEKADLFLRKDCGIKLRAGYGLSGGSGSHAARSQGKSDGRNTNVSATRAKKLY